MQPTQRKKPPPGLPPPLPIPMLSREPSLMVRVGSGEAVAWSAASPPHAGPEPGSPPAPPRITAHLPDHLKLGAAAAAAAQKPPPQPASTPSPTTTSELAQLDQCPAQWEGGCPDGVLHVKGVLVQNLASTSRCCELVAVARQHSEKADQVQVLRSAEPIISRSILAKLFYLPRGGLEQSEREAARQKKLAEKQAKKQAKKEEAERAAKAAKEEARRRAENERLRVWAVGDSAYDNYY